MVRTLFGSPFLPVDWHVQYLIAAIIVVLVIASLIFVGAAVRTLGKQWSLQARVLEHHELIRRGPYRIVRHPIYTGFIVAYAGIAILCATVGRASHAR